MGTEKGLQLLTCLPEWRKLFSKRGTILPNFTSTYTWSRCYEGRSSPKALNVLGCHIQLGLGLSWIVLAESLLAIVVPKKSPRLFHVVNCWLTEISQHISPMFLAVVLRVKTNKLNKRKAKPSLKPPASVFQCAQSLWLANIWNLFSERVPKVSQNPDLTRLSHSQCKEIEWIDRVWYRLVWKFVWISGSEQDKPYSPFLLLIFFPIHPDKFLKERNLRWVCQVPSTSLVLLKAIHTLNWELAWNQSLPAESLGTYESCFLHHFCSTEHYFLSFSISFKTCIDWEIVHCVP